MQIICLLRRGALSLLLASVGTAGATAAGSATPAAGPSGAPPASCSQTATLSSWPLGTLAAQTIAFPAEETDLSAITPAARAGYGGILLFGASAPSTLGQQLAALRSAVPGKLGLLVMTDEEGGGVQRMANLVGSMPWAAQMGASMTAAQIRQLSGTVASKMASYGVDMDLAPVVDVDGRAVEPGQQDPDGYRSFSGNTSVVSADGTAFMEGMKSGGVVPVLKHFPGLGGVSQNTDYGPGYTLPWSTLQKVALPPFQAGIKAGAPAVMISNAIVTGYTSVPASLSAKVVTTELRGALGFRGLILTDSLSAGAISDPPLSLSVQRAAVDAIAAGNDMVLFGSTGTVDGDLALASSTASSIVSAVGSGQISKSQLVAAALQVLDAKGVDVCAPDVAVAATADGAGYWQATAAGGVYPHGDAGWFGSLQSLGITPNRPVVSIATTPDGHGYWLVGSDGGVYSFGDAHFKGSTGSMHLNAPIVGMAATADGGGYWLVGADGGIYSFGDAHFHGSGGSMHLTSPVVGMAADLGEGPNGGYWIVAAKGAVYGFDAPSHGSADGLSLSAPIVGMQAAASGSGYRLVGSDGGVFSFGEPYQGSLAGSYLPLPITAVAAAPAGQPYWLLGEDGTVYSFGA